jgi:hypothetical protein
MDRWGFEILRPAATMVTADLQAEAQQWPPPSGGVLYCSFSYRQPHVVLWWRIRPAREEQVLDSVLGGGGHGSVAHRLDREGRPNQSPGLTSSMS